MFYGVDLALHDVVEFLKKKSDHQKEDVAKILLNKKFNKSMMEGHGQVREGNIFFLKMPPVPFLWKILRKIIHFGTFLNKSIKT